MHAARDRPAPRDGGPSQQDGGPNNLIFGWGMTSSSVVTGMFDRSGSWRGGPNSRDISRSSIMMMIGWVDEVDLDAMVRGLNSVSGFASVFSLVKSRDSEEAVDCACWNVRSVGSCD